MVGVDPDPNLQDALKMMRSKMEIERLEMRQEVEMGDASDAHGRCVHASQHSQSDGFGFVFSTEQSRNASTFKKGVRNFKFARLTSSVLTTKGPG